MKKIYFTLLVLFALLITIANCSKDNNEPPPSPNLPPTCNIITPTQGQEIAIGETVIISVEATDSDGSIAEVLFYIDGIEKGSDNSSPYNYNWETSNESIGNHTLKAISFDNNGDSSAVEISVIIVDAPSTFTDLRDGQIYNTVEIGDQTWFSENLNYETSGSACYYAYTSNCEIYGRLYSWNAALNACPTGWHLPSDDEWKTLEMHLGMSQSEADTIFFRGTNEGEKLKSDSGWYEEGNGNNESGFLGLPGGLFITPISEYGYIKEGGYWWTSTEDTTSFAWFRSLKYDDNRILRLNNWIAYRYSVRCIKD
jgi:uncharacterized protein (TIGR02145 family)